MMPVDTNQTVFSFLTVRFRAAGPCAPQPRPRPAIILHRQVVSPTLRARKLRPAA